MTGHDPRAADVLADTPLLGDTATGVADGTEGVELMGGKSWRWCVLGRHQWVTSTCGHTHAWLRCRWCNRLRMVTPAEWEARNAWNADR